MSEQRQHHRLRRTDRIAPPAVGVQELRILATRGELPIDGRASEEMTLRLAGYSEEQIAKLCDRSRRAA